MTATSAPTTTTTMPTIVNGRYHYHRHRHHHHRFLAAMMLVVTMVVVLTDATASPSDADINMEAAFQGHCGHTSPCEQLCYEIHDGMYECDCIEGYELNKNGYSCQVINSTNSGIVNGSSGNGGGGGGGVTETSGKTDEDVLYQKGASFSAKLANNDNDNSNNNKLLSGEKSRYGKVTDDERQMPIDSYDYTDENLEQQQQLEQQRVNSNDYYISAESINFNTDDQNDGNSDADVDGDGDDSGGENMDEGETDSSRHDVPEFKVAAASRVISTSSTSTTTTTTTAKTTTATATTELPSSSNHHHQHHPTNRKILDDEYVETDVESDPDTDQDDNDGDDKVVDDDDYYSYKADMSIYDDVNNNQLNLRRNSNKHTYQLTSNNKANNNNNNKNIHIKPTTTTSSKNNLSAAAHRHDLRGNRAQKQRINISVSNSTATTISNSGSGTGGALCNLDCGPDGHCAVDSTQSGPRCLCPFGKTGSGCNDDIKAHVPRFAKHSWLAFAALHGAYKHLQLRVEFRPESFDGIIVLSGERDDLTGDFMALLLNKGFVEFWFDCGSGVGSVRSRETIMLNEWNSVIIYRHRWDAWLVLNHGTKVQGRSNGLFSRITFREPVFLGGIGNTTGLGKRLPLAEGFVGCIRRFVANEHEYKFEEHPVGDVIKGFDIQDCITDKCVRYPCQHGGKCLPSDQGSICLCPIGFVGDLCEIRMDLQVPAFNGSSFLRYAPLGDGALIWLELKVILKPEHPDGLVLYSGPEQHGDFIALYLHNGFVEFAFDLGSGPAVVRSEHALSMGQWHTIRVSRTARLAVLKIDQYQEVMTISSNGFWHLSLAENLFVGGVNHVDRLPLDLKYKPFFVGCIQRIDVNGHSLGIVSEALGGSNIGNCPHACVARPCGPLAECVPQMESYECRCSIYNERCNKAAEVPPEQLPVLRKAPPQPPPSHKDDEDTKHNAYPKKQLPHNKKNAKKHKNFHKTAAAAVTIATKPPAPGTQTITINQQHSHQQPHHHHHPTNAPLITSSSSSSSPVLSNEEIEDDIIFRFVHENSAAAAAAAARQIPRQHSDPSPSIAIEKKPKKEKEHQRKHHVSKHEHNEKPNASFMHKLSRLPTHYESFQTNPDSDILTFDDNNDWVARLQQQDYADAMAARQQESAAASEPPPPPSPPNIDSSSSGSVDADSFVFDESLFDENDGAEEYHRKQLAQDMQRIMSNTHQHEKAAAAESDYNYSYDSNDELLSPVLETQSTQSVAAAGISTIRTITSTPQTHTDWSLLKKFDLSAEHQSQVAGVRKNFGACFAGTDSYFHYNDAETMSQVISYNIDLNLRIKTHSPNGVILWTGRQGTTEEHDDYLSLGIEQGYLHFRYDLGSGEVDIRYNFTNISDGLWHRVRAIRNSQEGYLEVDGRKTSPLRSPGKLRQLNTDTGLYVGGVPDVVYFTHQRYYSGIVGCISEIILAGEMKLKFDQNTLGTAHNVETGLL